MARGGMSEMHAKILQDKQMLEGAREHPWLALGGDIDFGIQRTDCQQLDSKLRGRDDPYASNIRSHCWFRELALQNIGCEPVVLMSISCLPQSEFIILSDDHRISQGNSEIGVQLAPGQSYTVTCCLKASRPISALLSAFFFLTFHTSEGPRLAMRRIGAALISNHSELEACLRVEATAFYPPEIKTIFNEALMSSKARAEERAMERRKMLKPSRDRTELSVISHHLENVLAEEICTEGDVSPIFFVRAKTAVFGVQKKGQSNGVSTFQLFNWPPFDLNLPPLSDESRKPSSWLIDPSTVPFQPYRGPCVRSNAWIPTAHGQTGRLMAVFEIPGLMENRPVVVTGDLVLCRFDYMRTSMEFEGSVASVDGGKLYVSMSAQFWDRVLNHPDFSSVDAPSPLCHLLLRPDQTPSRRQVDAIFRAASKFRLFPRQLASTPSTQESRLFFSEPMLQQDAQVSSQALALGQELQLHCGTPLNVEQRQAIASILLGAGSKSSSPFCIFGPPGTGKTVTLTECVFQLLRRTPSSRILICAPMNYSCDLITHSLAKAGLQPAQMMRLQDPRRRVVEAKAEILPYCCLDQASNQFVTPNFKSIDAVQVIVCSCYSAGILVRGKKYSFDYVLIDEAGQATVSETLIPATLSSGAVVLCGDPCQLGPVVKSKLAKSCGMEMSLLECLIKQHIGEGEDNMAMVMLRRNYRSHPDLLELPSRMFYRSALIPCADALQVQPPLWSETCPVLQDDICSDGEINPRACCLFYGVRGEQVQQGDVASFFNPLEAIALADLIQDLLFPSKGISPEEVGVICTYRKQVAKVRLVLRERGLGQVRVGTVDDYQGQEERVIFISTVLSKTDSQMGRAGWTSQSHFSNYKRFNVAITRAKALLVVVGHPIVLMQDPNWKELLRHCASRGSYKGEGKEVVYQALGLDSEENDHEYADDLHYIVAEQIAEIALLGYGDARYVYPTSAHEYELANEDEVPSRIAL